VWVHGRAAEADERDGPLLAADLIDAMARAAASLRIDSA
jgi:hypothetical protein